MLQLSDTIEQSQKISQTSLGDELALMSVETGQYYVLNSTAKKIWNLVKEPKTIEAIVDILKEEYDISKQECTRDIMELLEDLSKRSLIAVASYAKS